MKITEIVTRVNKKLAGEMLSFDDIKYFIDDVIDDINDALNSNFPGLSTWTEYVNTYNQANPQAQLDPKEYNVLPDYYIRTVLIPGAAYKFYVTDEEGERTSSEYFSDYRNGLFKITRDLISQVPVAFQRSATGFIQMEPEATEQVLGVMLDGESYRI